MSKINIATARNVVPSGCPTDRRWSAGEIAGDGFAGSAGDKVLFRRKSWVIAIPIEANAREVRSQARKVRSCTD